MISNSNTTGTSEIGMIITSAALELGHKQSQVKFSILIQHSSLLHPCYFNLIILDDIKNLRFKKGE